MTQLDEICLNGKIPSSQKLKRVGNLLTLPKVFARKNHTTMLIYSKTSYDDRLSGI